VPKPARFLLDNFAIMENMRKKIIIWGVVIMLLALAAGAFYSWRAPARNITWGVVFSQKQADNLGLDWRQVYLALLDDLGAEKIKIAAHWDLLEPQQGEYDFSDLDWQLAEASKRSVKIMPAIGMKTPRWPECHIPKWAEGIGKEKQQEAILAMLAAAVSRYKDNQTIESWQVENEPLFPFGECPWRDKNFLQQEIALVKALDENKRPVVVSDSGEGSWWLEAARAGDLPGVTMYRRVYFREVGLYVNYPLPPAFYAIKAKLINAIFGKRVICVELQTEPWAIDGKFDGGANDGKTMSLAQMKGNLAFAKNTGLDEFYLWGSEWWYWMKEMRDHSEFWEEIKLLIKN